MVFEVKTNRSKNRLYVTLDGYMDEAEVKKMTEQVEQAVQQLEAEFTMSGSFRFPPDVYGSQRIHQTHPKNHCAA